MNKETGVAYNKEVAPADADDKDRYEEFKASEVGNILPWVLSLPMISAIQVH